MSIFIKVLVKNKLKQLTIKELLHYGEQYGFSLSKTEAQHIVTYLKQNTVDPFDVNDRNKMFGELEKITNTDTAKKAQILFKELIHSYGLGHLFN